MKKLLRSVGISLLTIIILGSCSNSKKEEIKETATETIGVSNMVNDSVVDSNVAPKDAEAAAQTTDKVEVKKDVKNGKPSVIDFYATWCGPCKKIAPYFHELEKQYGSEINFMSVDVDKQPDVASEYGINSVPTFVFLDSYGSEIDRLDGAVPDSLKNKILKLLK